MPDIAYETDFGVARVPYLSDYRIGGAPTVAAPVFLEMVVAAVAEHCDCTCIELSSVTLSKPPAAPAAAELTISLRLQQDGDQRWNFVVGTPGGTTFAAGTAKAIAESAENDGFATDVDSNADIEQFYQQLADTGLELGDQFQVVQSLAADATGVFLNLRLDASLTADAAYYWLHPTLWTAAMHGVVLLGDDTPTYCQRIQSIRLSARRPESLRITIRPQGRRFNIVGHDSNGKRMLAIEGLEAGQINSLVASGNKASENMSPSEAAAERQKIECLNNLSVAYIQQAKAQFGADLAAEVAPKYQRLIQQWEQYTTRQQPINLEATKEQAKALWTDAPYLPAMIERCGSALAAVLKNEQSALELLFPSGSTSDLERLYQDSSLAVYFNTILRDVLNAITSRLVDRDLIRILEVGAGTGGTSAWLMPALAGCRVEYWYTDISDAFLNSARDKFSDYPFVRFSIFDAETAPEPQGLLPETFDVIIAANVVHATTNIAEVLQRLHSLLHKHGDLLLWEATTPQPWHSITFALLDGWQRFTDTNLRKRQPLLAVEQWTEILQQQGFEAPAAFPQPGSSRDVLGQHAIVARRGRDSVLPKRSTPVSDSDTTAALSYEIAWRETVVDDSATFFDGQMWVVFKDAQGFAEQLETALKETGARVVSVRPGEQFMKLGTDSYCVSPDSISQLFDDLELMGEIGCHGIVHCWALDLYNKTIYDPQCLVAGETSLVSLCRELTDDDSQPPQLWCVTSGAQATGSDDPKLCPVQAPAWGLLRSVAIEQPGLSIGLVDIAAADDAAAADLVTTMLHSNELHTQAAIRDGRVLVPRLVPMPLVPIARPSFTADAAYLITGGLGGVGIAVASWLIEHGARHVILLGRTTLPARNRWRDLVDNDSDTAATIRQIVDLERRGQVEYRDLDLIDAVELTAFFEARENQLRPPIRGVFHCAGVVADAAVEELDEERISAVFNPKVTGTDNLLTALDTDALDFAVFFSSAAAVLGSGNGGNDSAANAYLGGTAHRLRQRGINAQVIDWGIWEDLGMAVRDNRQERLSSIGMHAIAPAAALVELHRAMTAQHSQVIVADADWELYQRSIDIPAPLLAELIGEPAHHPQTAAPSKQPARSNDTKLVNQLRRFVSELLQLSPAEFDNRTPLQDLGFDSIMAVQLKSEIEMQFDVELTSEQCTNTNILKLAEQVSQRIPTPDYA